MKKRGFTLIELLAVIVILAIIALIATPIVMNVIEKSKQKSAEASMDQIERAAELYFYNQKVQGEVSEITFICSNGICKSGDNVLEISGKGPDSGTIIISSNGEISMSSMVIDGFACVKSDKGYSCTKYKSKDVSTTNGVITLKDVDDTSLNDYKIYGNSVEASDGSSKSVGELVTDQNDPNYGKYEIPIKVTGKNLIKFNVYGHENTKRVTNLEDLKNLASQGYDVIWSIDASVNTGEFGYSKSNPYYLVLEVEPNTEYSFSGYRKDGFIEYDENFNYIQTFKNIDTFTTSESAKYIVFYIYNRAQGPEVQKYTLEEIKGMEQLEKGSVATDYEPYQELTTNIYLDEPLTTNDYIDYKNQELSKNGVITKIELPSIQLFKGYNNIIVDTNVTPSNMTVNYYSSLK